MWQVSAVLVALLGLMLWLYTGQVEKRVKAQIAAVTARAATDYAHKTAKRSQEFNDRLAAQKSTSERALNETRAELDAMRDTAIKAAQNDPVGFGDDIHVRLARRMCLIQAGNNYGDRETCRNAAPEAFVANKYITVTVTKDNAEAWKELCEDGQRDFCEWSRTGLTANDWLTFLSWMDSVDAVGLEQANQNDGLRDIIKQITKPDDKPR